MDKFVVTNMGRFDGEYPIDIGSFTMREFQIVKRVSGVRAGELEEALAAGDTSVIMAIAVVAVRRNGQQWEAFERLAWETELGAIEFVGDAEDDTGTAGDAVPLIPRKPSEGSGSSDERPQSSGPDSTDDGDSLPEKNLRAIGSQV